MEDEDCVTYAIDNNQFSKFSGKANDLNFGHFLLPKV